MRLESVEIRRISFRASVAAFIAGLIICGASSVSGAESVIEALRAGKGTFTEECRKCHTTGYAISESYSEDDWYLTVNMMISNGAVLTEEQKLSIINYLTTKSLFDTKCSVCHPVERPLSKTKIHDEWRATVKRMAGKKSGHLTEDEIEKIAAFLTLRYPEPK
jgi:mono/diheme cytochrome c family protein